MPAAASQAKELGVFHSEQQIAYDKVTKGCGGIVWMGVGQGKTRVGILGALSLSSNPVTIVVCRREAFYDFKKEVATLQVKADVGEIENLFPNRKLDRRTFVLVSNGKLLSAATDHTIEALHVNQQIGAIIVDEGYLYKNPDAKTHLALRKWTEIYPTIVLSGSIMTARDLLDMFGQNAIAGRMHCLAKNKTAFRTEFMIGINDRGFTKWSPRPGSYNKILERLEPYTHIYMPRKQADRKITQNILSVPMTMQQGNWMEELKETAAVEGFFELSNMANVVQKAQQISNGWLSRGEGEDVEYLSFPSYKVDRTVALAEEIVEGSGKKVVIWCAFRYDIDRLMKGMANICNVATFRGGEAFDIEYWNRPDTMICLATMASGSSVNHFENCQYGIYFSQDNKWLNLQQSQGRHTRVSSAHKETFFTFLHSEKSLDAAVYYSVRTAQSQERGMVTQYERRLVEEWVKGK